MGFIGKIKSVSIVMPTYNEAGNVAGLIRESVDFVRRSGVLQVEVIVVDDDSPDHTWKVAMETNCPDADVRVIRRMENHGLTASLKEGIAAARMDVIVWFDCDFSQQPDKIPQLLFMINQGYDVAVNSRYVLGGGENRTGKGGNQQLFLSKWLNRLLRYVLNPAFHDYTSGFVAVRREVFAEIALRGDYGEYFIDFMFRVLRNKRYKVCELPYFMQPRQYGTSKTGSNLYQFIKRGRKYLMTILNLRLGR
jgi:dolichol-phosphate mannosyltransferase